MKKVKQFLLKEFLLPFKTFYVVPYKNWLYMRREKKAFKRACKIADHLSLTNDGRKFVVMKDAYGDFQSFNKDRFKILKRRGVFTKNITWFDVLRDANYITK